MKQHLAAEIHKHLLDAAAALKRAERVGLKLEKGERRAFGELLADVIMPLHFELLQALYAEHPELRPHEPGHISSVLRWEDVSLPTSVTEADIDSAIFAALRPRLMKVARIIGDVLKSFEARKLPISDEIIGARILALAEAGRIEGAGDLQMWMHSEVKLLP
jgi:hypothetical protein